MDDPSAETRPPHPASMPVAAGTAMVTVMRTEAALIETVTAAVGTPAL